MSLLSAGPVVPELAGTEAPAKAVARDCSEGPSVAHSSDRGQCFAISVGHSQLAGRCVTFLTLH